MARNDLFKFRYLKYHLRITLLVSAPIIFIDLESYLEGINLELLLDFKVYFSIGGNCLLLLFEIILLPFLLTLSSFYFWLSFESVIFFSDLNFFVLILKEDWVVF